MATAEWEKQAGEKKKTKNEDQEHFFRFTRCRKTWGTKRLAMIFLSSIIWEGKFSHIKDVCIMIS